MSEPTLKAPFPWFGGKSRVAPIVWEALGDVGNYVEPFAGSLAVLLGRPHAPRVETVNDLDGYVANFWRALVADTAGVIQHADWPVNEADLSARHAWLVSTGKERIERLAGDPDYYDVKVAGWWVWGLCAWIGSGWCSGKGPWVVESGRLVDGRKLPHLGDAGRGINRQLPHLGTAGMGINRQRGIDEAALYALAARLRRVRVCCGDWSRVCGPSVWRHSKPAGVFLDPPYAQDLRADLYRVETDVSAAVREWAVRAVTDAPELRVVLAGYEGEHAMPSDWGVVAWKAAGGYGSQGEGRGKSNAGLERLWLSPACNAVEGVEAAA